MSSHTITGLTLSLCLACAACTTPAQRVDVLAASLGLQQQNLWGKPFLHRIYRNRVHPTTQLHVYIEGDGLPWLRADLVSPDPTPRTPLLLTLLAKDPNPSVYLGRPCYFGFANIPPCSAWWWTAGRYAPTVVASLATVLAQLLDHNKAIDLTLIGHSGGGTLATLLAAYPLPISTLVTLAGNLDTDAWTQHHHYSPLDGSLNPANMPPLAKHIRQIHLQGGQDHNVPVELAQRYAAHQPNALFQTYPDFDHSCCWEKHWPMLLDMFATDLTKQKTGGVTKN